MHLETIGWTTTAPSTGAAAVACAGDSLTIKHGKNPRILTFWADHQTAGSVQIAFPTGHDTTRGFRARVPASEVTPRSVLGLAMPVTPQETLSITVVGSATAGDVENGCFVVMHDDLPGSNQKLMRWSDVVDRAEKLTTVDFTIDVTAGGAWNGSEAINAESDLLLANRDYAILGIDFGVECCAVSIKGPHSSGVRHAVPGSVEFADMAQSWFAVLSRAYGDAATIPVFNSANKANTLLEALQDENVTDVTGSIMLVLLK
jgi:hypothetical protein